MASAVSLSTIVLRGEWLTNKLSLVRMIKLILQVLKWAVFASALRENIVRTLVDGAEKAHINEHQRITKKRTIFDRVICFCIFLYAPVTRIITILTSLPLLNLAGKIQGSNWKVHGLKIGYHSINNTNN